MLKKHLLMLLFSLLLAAAAQQPRTLSNQDFNNQEPARPHPQLTPSKFPMTLVKFKPITARVLVLNFDPIIPTQNVPTGLSIYQPASQHKRGSLCLPRGGRDRAASRPRRARN